MPGHLAIIFHLLAFVKYFAQGRGADNLVGNMTDGSFITITTIIALLVIAPTIYDQNATGGLKRLVNHTTRLHNFIRTRSSTVLQTITTLREMLKRPNFYGVSLSRR